MTSYYLTTPIYYVNDKPHIGHCYTTTIADVIARFQRLAGRDVFLLTGTDEHADKVVTSAAAHGTTPQAWADRNAAEFKKAFEFMGVSNDDFIRTTEARHKDKVSGYIRRLLDSGDIYKGEYTGWYDEGQEEYLTETAAKEANFHSPINKKPLVKRTEPCYFFRLGKYQDWLRGVIESGEFRVSPEARKSEVLGRLRPPAVLNDVPVSRPVTSDPATQWGIRIPGDEAHRVYVWIDALFNYFSVVDTPERRRHWPAAVHLIGKDILWFHAVIWPALLRALGEPLPREVFGHGWWISEGEKMSKSLGNFIDLDRLKAYAAWVLKDEKALADKEGRAAEPMGLDPLRWYLATQGPMQGADADFSHAKFVETYNADLANGIGNCASRVGNMVEKYFGGVLPGDDGCALAADPAASHTGTRPLREEFDWAAICRGATEMAVQQMDRLNLPGSLGAAMSLVRSVDLFIGVTRPFTVAKRLDTDPKARAQLSAILYQCAEVLRIASVLLSPVLIERMPRLWRTWGCAPPAGATLAAVCQYGGSNALRPGQTITKGGILYMRAGAGESPA